MAIPFNKPYMTGKETDYIQQAVKSGKISGHGLFTEQCHRFFENHYGFQKVLLTTSCTDALEMAAILIDIGPGDEVIAPSYAFVSTVNAFVLRGAKIVFCDSKLDHPSIDEDLIEALITPKTKAIVLIHYAGTGCEMAKVMALAEEYHLYVIEDAAQAIDAYYQGQALGSFGHFGALSFHETKNIISGEGGLLIINDAKFNARAEIIWEKGTNRSAFFRGEVDKYQWVDVGSSFLPSDIIAAFLYAQLENLKRIQNRRKLIWETYREGLQELENQAYVQLPKIPLYTTNNAHMFYLVCHSLQERTELIDFLKQRGIYSVFHYLSLHKSPYYRAQHDGRDLPHADRFSDCLLRLPLYYELTLEEVHFIISSIIEKFTQHAAFDK